MIPDISVVDNFFNEKQFDIICSNLNKISFINNRNDYSHYGFSHNFLEDESNKWIYDKIKFTFFPNNNLEVIESSFRLRHNKNEVLPHLDIGNGMDYNCIIYLKGEELMYNGTGFYNYKQELDRYIGFIENRALFFRGRDIYHTDLQALGKSSPRYSMNIFYKNKDK